MTDLHAAAQFIAAHARLIDRRRFAALTGEGTAEDVVGALRAYRNADGGIGCLEPDLRTPASQPLCVLNALEILHEAGAADDELTTGALDWLAAVSGDDGGVRSVLDTAAGWPHAPWLDPKRATGPSLLMTAGLAAAGLRLGLRHPWLDGAASFCWARVAEARTTDSYTLRHVLQFLDAAPDRDRAEAELDALAERIPADGLLPVAGGVEGEVLRPLDVVPHADHAARRLYGEDLLERELDRLEAAQEDDGGWSFDWLAWNPTAAWEWRGAVTVAALRTLRDHGRLAGVPAALSRPAR
jgi:hypothetical protein